MVKEDWAKPIAKTAAKAFTRRFDPNKPTIQLIFHENWSDFCIWAKSKNLSIRPVVFEEVDKMTACGTLDMGFEIYECPQCHRHHIICYTCKSRFCSSCGTKMTKQRAFNISEYTLDVKHRHVVFTIDHRLRNFFRKDRQRLRFLFDAAWQTLSFVFNKAEGRKNNPFTPGAIMCLHTFGRDLKWNPHIHCLLTEGGMDSFGHYKSINYINYTVLRKSWMKQLLDVCRDSLPKGTKEYRSFMNLRATLFKELNNGFYVNAPPKSSKSKTGKQQVTQYIIRYAGRPAMAQSRITNYDFKSRSISYWYEDHKTEEEESVTEHIFQFISKLILHIPDKQFKMIRYFGIYSTCDHKHKPAYKILKAKHKRSSNFKDRPKHYRRDLVDTFGVDPLLCTCGAYMIFVDSCVPSRFQYDDDESSPP